MLVFSLCNRSHCPHWCLLVCDSDCSVSVSSCLHGCLGQMVGAFCRFQRLSSYQLAHHCPCLPHPPCGLQKLFSQGQIMWRTGNKKKHETSRRKGCSLWIVFRQKQRVGFTWRPLRYMSIFTDALNKMQSDTGSILSYNLIKKISPSARPLFSTRYLISPSLHTLNHKPSLEATSALTKVSKHAPVDSARKERLQKAAQVSLSLQSQSQKLFGILGIYRRPAFYMGVIGPHVCESYDTRMSEGSDAAEWTTRAFQVMKPAQECNVPVALDTLIGGIIGNHCNV